MVRDWRADAAAAEEFFGLFGGTVNQRLEHIAAIARSPVRPEGRKLQASALGYQPMGRPSP
jgi:hypothetical protein